MYQAPEGRPRSTPPTVWTEWQPAPPVLIGVDLARPMRSEAHCKALSRGMRAEYQRRQRKAMARAIHLNDSETARLWVNASKYRRIFGLGANIGPHAHAVARGYETRAVTGQGKWTAWVIAVPDADLPEQYRPVREAQVKYVAKVTTGEMTLKPDWWREPPREAQVTLRTDGPTYSGWPPSIDRTPQDWWANNWCNPTFNPPQPGGIEFVTDKPRPSLWQRFLAWWRS